MMVSSALLVLTAYMAVNNTKEKICMKGALRLEMFDFCGYVS